MSLFVCSFHPVVTEAELSSDRFPDWMILRGEIYINILIRVKRAASWLTDMAIFMPDPQEIPGISTIGIELYSCRIPRVLRTSLELREREKRNSGNPKNANPYLFASPRLRLELD